MAKEADDTAQMVPHESLPLPGEIADRSELMLRLLPDVERGLRGEGEQAKFYSRLRDDIAGNDFFTEVTGIGLATLVTISQDPQHHIELMAILESADFRQALTRDIAIEYMAAAYDQATAAGRDTLNVDDPDIREEFRQSINRRTGELLDRAIAIVVGPLLVTETAKLPAKKRHKIKPPTRSLVFPNEHGDRALIFAVTKEADAWEVSEQGLRLRTPILDPERIPLAITFAGEVQQGERDMLEAVIGFLPNGEDGTVLKTLLALPALFFDHNPAAQHNAAYEVTIPDFMRYMGFKAKNGSFDRDDQERVWRSILLLSRIWTPGITAHRKRGQSKAIATGQGTWRSPIIVLQGVQEGPYGLHLPQAVRYSLGKEFYDYFTGDAGDRSRMLSISPRVMELHGRYDLNPLRLTYYYSGQFRINKQGFKHGRQHIVVRYATLLEQSGIPIDRKNPARQFNRVEQWHNELVAKGIIGGFDHPATPPKGSSFADYATLLFSVQPPTVQLPPSK